MQAETWLRRTVAVWPSLPYAALGFISAWNMLAFTGAVWVSSPDLDSIYRKQLYILSTASFAITLLVLAANEERVRPLLERLGAALVGGLVSVLGSTLIIIVGPYFIGPSITATAGTSATNMVYYMGCVIAGIGNAILITKCADLYGGLLPRNIIVRSAQALITAVAIYFLATGFPTWRYQDEGPLVIGTGAFISLPLLAGALLTLGKYSTEQRPRHNDAPTDAILPRPFWRMIFVLSFLSFAGSLMSGYASSVVPLVDSTLSSAFITLLQIPVALTFIAFAVTYDSIKRSFGHVFMGTLAITALAVALAPTAGRYYAPFYQMLPFAMYVFTFCYRSLLFFAIFQRHASAPVVFGIGYGFFALADSLGWLAGSLFLPDLPDTAVMGIGIGAAFLALAGSFLLFSAKDFDDLFEAVEGDQETLSSLMQRRLDSGADIETHRGKFKIAIDIITDEYRLSRREKDVLRHLAMGHDSTRIAEELGVSWNTVRTHTRNLYGKLDIHSKQELTALVDSYRNA